uniref:Ig-like domain-containing protein n=1 Tax=Graphocephala atropunctata TaxID=36148 RepID=A0A1B6KBL5_9HEMI
MNLTLRNIWMPSNLFAALFLGLILSGVYPAVVSLRDNSVLPTAGGEGVKIKEIKVPDVVLNGTKPVVLDCDYVLDDPAGLVVKWFFNNHPAPVYQWIFKQKPQVLGVLKGKINLNYRATNEEFTMYRAIEIITPTMDLSGEYKCLVSTFDQEVSKSKKMIVYVPEKSLEVTQEKPREDKVNITCEAEGVYPEPNMTITALESKHTGYIQVTTRKQNNSSLYDIKGTLSVDDVELSSPTTFVCELSIPDAHYSNRRELVYFPASGTTLSPSILSMFALLLSILISRTGL